MPQTLKLYAHPFSSYCQKVLMAFYENGTPFEYRLVGPEDPSAGQELEALWPLKRFPALVDGDRRVLESTAIIEYLDVVHPGPLRLVPQDPLQAIEVRSLDRVFDCYVMTPMQKIVLNHMRSEPERDPVGVAEAHSMLDKIYRWLDGELASRTWAAGEAFSLADCAAAPSLLYADWVHEIPTELAALRGYRARLLARPSYARALNEARPYRHFFPPGAPERD